MQSRIREDVLHFLLPGFLVLVAGAVVSVWEFSASGATLTWSPWTMLGTGLMILGPPTSIVAAITLGRFYSSSLVTRDGHRLITHGVYKHTRHPIYLGTIMVMVAIPLIVESLYGLLIFSLLIPLLLRRITMEERMLIAEFGEEYRRYMETTSKLIPHVY